MQNNTTVYIKKLVKIVYEKEKQIELMKKTLKERQNNRTEENVEPEINSNLKRQIQYTSSQLKEVNFHVLGMENRMLALEEQIKEEMTKNYQLQDQNKSLKSKYQEICRKLTEQQENVSEFEAISMDLAEKKQKCEMELEDLEQNYREEMEILKQLDEKSKLAIIKLETSLSQTKLDLHSRLSQLKSKSKMISTKDEENQTLNKKLFFRQGQILKLKEEIQQLNESYSALSNDNSLLKLQVQTLQDSLNMKQNQSQMFSQSLKDYEEFAFGISQYIESSFVRHCCQGKLRSSKKLIKQVDNCHTRFETTFAKMSQIQLWMDGTAEKLQKVIQQGKLPDETLEDLSNIAHSFAQKLQLCDLTQRMQIQKIENDKNEELLLDNLQKELEKSQMRDRSKLVELDEVKQVLKVTKDINRELLSELNSKDHIIRECRKLIDPILKSKSNPEYKNIKNLLNIKL